MGVIPEDWDHLRVGNVARVKGGKRLPPGFALVDGPTPHPYVRVSDMHPGGVDAAAIKYVPEAAFPAIESYRIYGNDIFISVAGTLGIVGVVPPELSGANLTENADRITDLRCERDFLKYWLMSAPIQQAIESLRTVGAQPKLALGRITKFDIAVPREVLEQRAIAEALSDVDGLLGALEALIAKKRAIRQGAMQQLLTGKTRLPGFSGTWREIRLSDVADKQVAFSFAGGPFGSNLKASEYTPHGVRIVQLQNIGDGKFNDEYAIYTSEEKADELRSCNIFPGEIIISKMGDPVARACLIPERSGRYLMASDGIRLAVNRRQFSARFIHDYINSPAFRNRAVEASTGSTRMRIGLGALRRLPVRSPELSEQEAIATVLFDMDAEIAALEGQRDKTLGIKQGMMQQLLTGLVRLVRPAPAEADA